MQSTKIVTLFLAGLIFSVSSGHLSAAAKPRARDLGIPLEGKPGPLNAITDVAGVRVGHATIIQGQGPLKVGQGPVRTGVTAILPTGTTFRPVLAAWDSLNGNGEMTGLAWVEESGFLEEPILLTNTRSVGVVHDAVWEWRRTRKYHDPEAGLGWAALPVVGETWDGRLNDVHGNHVSKEHVFSALDGASAGPVAEGNVGGGTGMVCHRFKGGIGTASRQVEGGYTIGVLVQANYGKRETLTIAGVPVGREIKNLMPEMNSMDEQAAREGNSILVVLATDAPLLPHQLKRLAKRVPLGFGRVGGLGANSSGDFFLAFSTAPAKATDRAQVRVVEMLDNDAVTPFFLATIEAVEEATLNALVAAETMTGINGNKIHALPHDRLVDVLKKYQRWDSR
jgi:L-aminopeptidase/D-esterase-like protein